jgi:ribosome biogenesis GTPase
MPLQTITGLIVRAQSGFFSVETGSGTYTCQLRGQLKKGPRLGDLAALGDRAEISVQADGTGMIEAVLPRGRAITRLDPRPQGVYRQVILANPDEAVFVFACAQPSPSLRMLDRFLVIAEKERIPAVIVANKVDLVGLERARETFGHYASLGYIIIYTSVKENPGLDELRSQLRQAGPAGPSAWQVQPAECHPADWAGSPRGEPIAAQGPAYHGGSSFSRWMVAGTSRIPRSALGGPITPALEELDAYFPELALLVAECQFSDCSHRTSRVAQCSLP